MDYPMVPPPVSQQYDPFGVNGGGVNPAIIAVNANAATDSWLTVGITDGGTAGALGTIGIPFGDWTGETGITVDNGAVLWMAPDDGPSDSAVIAQITPTASDGSFSATLNVRKQTGSFAVLSRCLCV